MFKKTAIAAAVASAVSVPMATQAADPPTVYGFVNIGITNVSIEGNEDATGTPQNAFGDDGVGSTIFVGAPDGSTHASDTANTRFGFKGSKDLGNGLSAGYKIEIGTGTTSGNRGGPVEDAAPWDKRIAQVSFSGAFGTVTLGNQWGILYEYLGWNVFRSDGNGGAAWYEGTRHINNDRYGLRVSNAYTYTYGGGGYSADPFTFSVQAYLDPDTATNDETIDGIAVGGMVTFGDVSINGIVYSENDDTPGAAEPDLVGIGFRWNITDALYVGGTFMETDVDDGRPDDATAWNIIGTYDFGGGFSGIVGIGGGETGQGGSVGDFDTFFLQGQKALGQGTKIYIEIETAERELAVGPDAENTVVAVAVKNVF